MEMPMKDFDKESEVYAMANLYKFIETKFALMDAFKAGAEYGAEYGHEIGYEEGVKDGAKYGYQ